MHKQIEISSLEFIETIETVKPLNQREIINLLNTLVKKPTCNVLINAFQFQQQHYLIFTNESTKEIIVIDDQSEVHQLHSLGSFKSWIEYVN